MSETELEQARDDLEAWLKERNLDLVLYSSGGPAGDVLLEDKATHAALVIR